MNMDLYNGRPDSTEGRLPREIRTYDFLDSLGIEYKLALFMLLANIEILNFDVDAANCYGKIRADLEKKGTPIGPLDMMIAGHAMSMGYTVVTNNVKEFTRVPYLKIENWAE